MHTTPRSTARSGIPRRIRTDIPSRSDSATATSSSGSRMTRQARELRRPRAGIGADGLMSGGYSLRSGGADRRLRGDGRQAAAGHGLTFGAVRAPVQVHGVHHRHEDDRIVEQVQLYAREEHLGDAGGHGPAEQVMVGLCLNKQQQVLEVMPELDAQRYVPPGPGPAMEAVPEHPEPDQHDNREAVVQPLLGY